MREATADIVVCSATDVGGTDGKSVSGEAERDEDLDCDHWAANAGEERERHARAICEGV